MTDPAGGFGWRAGTTPWGLKGVAARAEHLTGPEPPPLCVLLLPRELEHFILRDQAEDLLTGPGVIAVEPARIPYGAYLRLPEAVGDGFAAAQARRMRLPGVPKAVVIFHPLQYPLARGLIVAHPEAELWYWRWDRYEAAYDATPRQRERLEDLHIAASARAALTVVVSDALREDDAPAVLVPLAADSFPAPDPVGNTIAVSLGHLGRRTDWKLLRAVAEGMPELTLLLIGEWHDDESGSDEDYRYCRATPNFIWLGRRTDEEAARLIGCADVGIVPFEHSEFNETALPYRIIKYARQGRRAIVPDMPGMKTWEAAITVAEGPEAWIEALRAAAGTRARPDLDLREWALRQTAHEVNRPLWERMESLGIESGRLGSERVPPAPTNSVDSYLAIRAARAARKQAQED